jgi:hypothetical protein
MSLFLSVAPLVESTMDSYGYCYQNPLKFIDPTGMAPEGHWVGQDGNLIYDDGIDDGKIYMTNAAYEEHQGDIEKIKENSYLVIDNGVIQNSNDFKDLIQTIAKKVDITIGNIEIDSYRLKKDYTELVEFTTTGLSLQLIDNNKIGVYLENDPIVDIKIRNRDKGDSTIPTLKSYYNILNTLEHEKSHVNDWNSFPRNPREAMVIKDFNSFKRSNEYKAVGYQKRQASWEKTTPQYKKAVNNYVK